MTGVEEVRRAARTCIPHMRSRRFKTACATAARFTVSRASQDGHSAKQVNFQSAGKLGTDGHGRRFIPSALQTVAMARMMITVGPLLLFSLIIWPPAKRLADDRYRW